MMKYFIGALTYILLLVATQYSYGQRFTSPYKYISVGAHIGTTHYQGDLDDHGFEPWRGGGNAISARLLNIGFGFEVNYHFKRHMFFRLQYNQGYIGGADSLHDDEARRWRNLHFKSTIHEVSLQLVYEFLATEPHYEYYRKNYVFRPKWSHYIFTGINVFGFNPKAKPEQEWVDKYPDEFMDDKDWVELQPLHTQGQTLTSDTKYSNNLPDEYSLIQISIPFGAGIRYRLNDRFDIRFEISLRKTFTDFLDDVGGSFYAPPDELLDSEGGIKSFLFADRSGYANYGINRNPDATPASRRGAFWGGYGAHDIRGYNKDKDWYGFLNIGFTYIL